MLLKIILDLVLSGVAIGIMLWRKKQFPNNRLFILVLPLINLFLIYLATLYRLLANGESDQLIILMAHYGELALMGSLCIWLIIDTLDYCRSNPR